MKKIRFFLGLFTALLFVSCGSTKAATSDSSQLQKKIKLNSSVVTGQLDNGMSYFVLNNKEPANRITLRLVVKAGSCVEEDNQKGVAHFIEHLAFNGTTHFEKNSIIDFFEEIGMNFGADLNAYTSFEETVYQLEVPADNPEYLETALLILHDWASEVTFSQEEIDKERGVVTEEWRGRRGLSGRIQDNYIPFVMKDSRYEKRLPIGDMEIIKNVSRDTILDFYKKWYRPELMSVIVVGDAKTANIVSAVKKTMSQIPASSEKITAPVFSIPNPKEKRACVMKDSEQPYTIAQFMEPDKDFHVSATEQDIKDSISFSIGAQVLEERMSELTMQPDSPWLSAGIVNTSNTNNSSYSGLAFIPKDGLFIEGMKLIFDEYDRFLMYGASTAEIKRVKDSMLSSIEQKYKNKDKVKSSSVAQELVKYFVCGEVSMSEDDYYKLAKKYIPLITAEEIYSAVKYSLGDRGSLLFVLASDKAKDIPSEKELVSLWKNYDNTAALSAYNDDIPEGQLMAKPAENGKVVSKTSLNDLKATKYVLENGATIIVKKTDFENEKISFAAISAGGTSLVSDSDYPSATVATEYATYSGLAGMTYSQLMKATSSNNINFNVRIGRQAETISGSTAVNDLEVLLQLINLTITEPQFSDEGWNQVIVNSKQQADNYGVKPNEVYLERIRKILFGDSIRHQPMNKTVFSKLDKNKAEKIYRQRFNNAADFTFIFVGDINEKNLIDLCCSYLGTIPGDKSKLETQKYEKLQFPKGITVETVRKGKEPQGNVYISFGGSLPAAENVKADWTDQVMMGQLQSFLDMRLREIIREDKGGTYGVGVYGSIDGLDPRNYQIQISFGCEPERAEELTAAVIDAVEEIKSNPIDEIYISKINETYRRTRETNLRNNRWWLNKMINIEVMDVEPLEAATDTEYITNLTTAEELQRLAKKYMNTENYIAVYLKPE